MRNLLLVFLIALAGCGKNPLHLKPMAPEAVAAAVKKCESLGLKPVTFISGWDGTIVEVQCHPKDTP